MNEKTVVLERISNALLQDLKPEALSMIINEYPFEGKEISSRKYSQYEKTKVFMRDGFVDRYTGNRLINPGLLKILSVYFPNHFPYHPNWKMTETHSAYWDFHPTIDHLVPIAQGGQDEDSNWVTTSMFNNSRKANWTLEQLQWQLYEPGDIRDWNGLSNVFLQLVEKDKELLKDKYIKERYNATKKVLRELEL